MIADSNGDRSGDTRPLWITGLSPPDSWRSLRQPGYLQLDQVRTPKHCVWGVRPHAQSEKFSIDKSGKFSVAIDKSGAFDISGGLAREWLRLPANPNGRDRWLNPPEWVEWVDEPIPGYPKRPFPLDEAAAKELRKRTLTNLYNARPQWLADAHAVLDAAVAAAYGWDSETSDSDALERLFARNSSKSG